MFLEMNINYSDKMRERMISNEKSNFKLVWLIIFFSPTIVAVLVSIHIVDILTLNDWIGFYAAIVEGLLSGLLTFYSMYISLNSARKQITEQREAITC